jgi:hypothetical protein
VKPRADQQSSVFRKHGADLDALVAALAPIAALCLKTGNGAGDLVVAAKIACIAAAAPNAKIGNRLNHSRISAATGLTRKEIRALSGLTVPSRATKTKSSTGQRTSRVVQGWKTDPEFQDDKGTPATLTVRGSSATFPVLVRRYGGDVTPVSVLKELQRIGVVSKKATNEVKLLKLNIRSPGFTKDNLVSFGEQMRAVGNSIISNVEKPEGSNYAAYAALHDLTPDEAALFQSLFSERSAALIDGVQRWYGSQFRVKRRKERSIGSKSAKATIGIYLFRG